MLRQLPFQKQHVLRTDLRLSLTLTLILMLSACSSYKNGPTKPPPPSAKNPPIYPDAQLIEDQNEPSGQREPARRLTFETSDGINKVFAYYKDVLLKEGWQSEHWSDQPSNSIAFIWNGAPIYSITVTVKSTSASHMTVELYLLGTWPE